MCLLPWNKSHQFHFAHCTYISIDIDKHILPFIAVERIPPIVESWINIFPRVHFSAPNFQTFSRESKNILLVSLLDIWNSFLSNSMLFSTAEKYKRSYSRWTKYSSEYKIQIHSNKCNVVFSYIYDKNVHTVVCQMRYIPGYKNRMLFQPYHTPHHISLLLIISFFLSWVHIKVWRFFSFVFFLFTHHKSYRLIVLSCQFLLRSRI